MDVLIKWVSGVCITGFFFLLGLQINLSKEMSKKVSYKDLEKFINDITDKLIDLKECLTGNYDRKGLIQEVSENKNDIKHMNEKCELKKCLNSNTERSEK